MQLCYKTLQELETIVVWWNLGQFTCLLRICLNGRTFGSFSLLYFNERIKSFYLCHYFIVHYYSVHLSIQVRPPSSGRCWKVLPPGELLSWAAVYKCSNNWQASTQSCKKKAFDIFFAFFENLKNNYNVFLWYIIKHIIISLPICGDVHF